MAQQQNDSCPTCMGKGIIEGVCETSPEWDGLCETSPDWDGSTDKDDNDGRICTPDQQCPTCKGTGKAKR